MLLKKWREKWRRGDVGDWLWAIVGSDRVGSDAARPVVSTPQGRIHGGSIKRLFDGIHTLGPIVDTTLALWPF